MRHSGKLTTIDKALNASAPTLGTLQREKTKDFAIGLTMGWLVYLNDILNLNKPMTEDQIELCAIEINETYYSLKISDLTFLFKKIISGTYGEFYESLTIPKVLSFSVSILKNAANSPNNSRNALTVTLKATPSLTILKT